MMSRMEQPAANRPMPDYPRTPDGKYKYTTWDGEPKHIPSMILPGLGNAQILPDWVHIRLRKLFRRTDTPR
jgi:hypothetical protein